MWGASTRVIRSDLDARSDWLWFDFVYFHFPCSSDRLMGNVSHVNWPVSHPAAYPLGEKNDHLLKMSALKNKHPRWEKPYSCRSVARLGVNVGTPRLVCAYVRQYFTVHTEWTRVWIMTCFPESHVVTSRTFPGTVLWKMIIWYGAWHRRYHCGRRCSVPV